MGKLKTFYEDYVSSYHISFKSIGYTIGWLGAIYRTALTLALAIFISKLTKSDPILYFIILGLLLGYALISLAANLILIVGLKQERPFFFLPYLILEVAEIFTCAVLYIGGIILVINLEEVWILSYLIPSGLIILGTYIFLWMCLVKLYYGFKKKQYEKTSNHDSDKRNEPFMIFERKFKFSKKLEVAE